MSDTSNTERRFHETWLGMVQPIDGLVVSIPVLVDAQCMERQPPETQARLLAVCPPTRIGETGPDGRAIADLDRFLEGLLGYTRDHFDRADAIPDALSLWVPEGKQALRPTLALKRVDAVESTGADVTEAVRAGSPYEMLVWDLPQGLSLDASETTTGTWEYPPSAKFDRLLRHCRVPIGLLTNRESVRLIYAPHGESSGAITFNLDDMASVGGRPILDALVMLLSATRFFGVAKERALPAILAESRKRQANVTNDLAEQVFDALQILLRGFEAAAERDGGALLDDAVEREGDHLYKGLLTVLLRLVFLLYAEDRALLPVEHPVYAGSLSVLGLFEELQRDRGAYPDSMPRRFGAWGRLIALFRAVFLGVEHGDDGPDAKPLRMPPRRGSLFDPNLYPFLEGWGPAGGAPIVDGEARSAVRLPTVDDDTIHRVLEKLLIFEGQRLSYRTLDVEQIGSVYEALMGYHVVRVAEAAVCLRPNRVWLTAEEVLALPANRRAKWIKETIGLSKAQAEKLAADIAAAKDVSAMLDAMASLAAGGRHTDPSLTRARLGQLVLQPGAERRRTSSHYTPRSLSTPIVRRTLEPLLAVMGETPASERILNLKVCDPAMGSGAFLVEACRFLADHVVAAWTREGVLKEVTAKHGDVLMHARRLVAQRCLYGVDKNDAAVELAKLSLWLVTLAKNLPFTFVDHALRHGDSLVGLDFEQIRSFHWKPGKQLEFARKVLDEALAEGIELRQKILALAESDAVDDQREKERLLWDARDALDRVRLVGDVVVGAFFARDNDKEREKERTLCLDLVKAWLHAGGPPPEDLRAMQDQIRTRIPVFHWMLEFPEVFYAARPDPLENGVVNRAAYMDAFLGNPPFLGGKRISTELGDRMGDWVSELHESSKNVDLCVHFLRRAFDMLGTHGAFGFVATNSVAQGDNRTTGLAWILKNGGHIPAAVRSMPWPGEASVTISVVHVTRGAVSTSLRATTLNGVACEAINSQLLPRNERADPAPLAANANMSFNGSYVAGQGFFLTRAEGAALVACEPGLAIIIKEYIGGEELLASPAQSPVRSVIDFGNRPLSEAADFSTLLDIVREKVKPLREATRLNTGAGGHGKKYWWQFISRCDPLYAAISKLRQCLVVSQISKHLIFAWQPTSRVFGHTTYVIASDSPTAFATLQSRVHETWARLLSSTMEETLRYTPSDCFETFPFSTSDPRRANASLDGIGDQLNRSRAKFMRDGKVGLTGTYNQLKDPSFADRRVLELRQLHAEMDRAVLDAYGWTDVVVPPYCPSSDDERRLVERFEAEVIDRLFALNARRAEEERLKGVSAGAKQRGAKRPPKKQNESDEAQQTLLDEDS